MKAALLAAGLGTRFRPLTNRCPKVLAPVLNQPLLGVVLRQLEAAGFVQMAVNTHHLAEKVQHFLGSQPWGFNLQISHEPELLGTGGGLRQLGVILGTNAPFLAVNGDILTDLDLAAIYRGHQEGAVATLVLHDYPLYNTVWRNRGGMVAGIGQVPPPGSEGPPLAYTGVQVVSPKLLLYLPGSGYYDLVQAWREALAAGETLAALVVSGHFWEDLGTPASYLEAHRRLLKGEVTRLAPFFKTFSDPLLGTGTVLEEGVSCQGGVCLGNHVWVGNGARLKNTVVWDGACIAPGVHLENCLVDSGANVTHSARNQILSS